jgi:hypothetical protein
VKNVPHPAEEVEGPHVGAYSVGRLLGGHGLGVGLAGEAVRSHEHLGLRDLPGFAVDDGDGLPGEVGEELLSRLVVLTHGDLDRRGPAPVELAEPRVGVVVVRVVCGVLMPQERQRHALARELAVQEPHVSKGLGGLGLLFGVDELLECFVVHLVGQRPGDAGVGGTFESLADGRGRDVERPGYLPVGQMRLLCEPQYVFSLSHG